MEYTNDKTENARKSEQRNRKMMREKLKKALENEYIGKMPARPDHLRVEKLSEDRSFAAGTAVMNEMQATVTVSEKEFAINFKAAIPTYKTKIPAFIVINESEDLQNLYTPAEEITDSGFALFSFSAYSVSENNTDFKSKVGKLFPKRRTNTSPGKIAIWAWTASVIMDCVMQNPMIDKERIAVIGHGHLGAAALVAGAFDERFKFVIANGAGYFGAALLHCGEDMSAALANSYSHLYTPAFSKSAAKIHSHKYDNDMLLSLILPRHVIIGEALGDFTVSPEREYKALLLAAKCDQKDIRPEISDISLKSPAIIEMGTALFYLRDGGRYLSRRDWQTYMSCLNKTMEQTNEI